ncbi:putative NACHT domain-containing protein [Seiridium unicorne]|uniref:NACHT domain-containing protein n=1 Tax=Seiridium unicorne TaxID=138068 RepID=A0ABR2UI62_9PEZI
MSSRFKPAASTLARQTIRIACEDLDSTITPTDSREFPTTTLQHVKKAALDIESQLAARQSLRNMRRLMPLFQGLEHYAKVVDVLCNGTPYLAWIWAPITLILRVASEYVEAFEVIMNGYSKIAGSLVRFEILEEAFPNNAEFQQTVAVFYADILHFHKFAYSFVRRSSWKLMFLTSWGRFQRRFNSILGDLDRHGALIDQEANARHISESLKHWQDIQSWREDCLERVNQQEAEQATKQFHYIASWLKANDSEQVAICSLASSEVVKYPGTCSWALKNQKLITWLREDTNSSICWLQGIPGAGKTVLVAQILAFLRASTRTVVTHFINPLYATSTAYDQLLRSLLLQLLREDRDLAAYVYNTYVTAKNTPTISTLEQLVKTLFTTTSHKPRQTQYIWILVDGFDACEPNKQASLISLVNQLVSKNSQSGGTVCKILIASRASPILSKRLRNAQVISLTEEKHSLNSAIKYYATQRLDSLRYKFDQLHLSPSDLEDIQGAVARKADGMFLYARLILDYLERKIFYFREEVLRSIDDLPKELSDYYRTILAQIVAPLDSESVDRVRSLFGWIAFTKRPLKRLELLSAVTFTSSDHSVPHLVPDFLLTVCGALVEELPDATLAFIHVTVKEFLQSPSSNLALNYEDTILEHGIALVTCLRAGLHVYCDTTPQHDQIMRAVTGMDGLQLYASDHWVDYLFAAIDVSSKTQTELPVYRLAVDLAQQADYMGKNHFLLENYEASNIADDRLESLRDIQLRELVRLTLESRYPKVLEAQIFLPAGPDGFSIKRDEVAPRTALQGALAAYQSIVRFLLQKSDYPGITSEDLNRFKHQLCQSAFTCRLGKCYFATVGFESEKLRDEHEMTHGKPILCPIAGCKYPPLVSESALKRHLKTLHLIEPARAPIRRPEKVSKKQQPLHLDTTRRLESSTLNEYPMLNLFHAPLARSKQDDTDGLATETNQRPQNPANNFDTDRANIYLKQLSQVAQPGFYPLTSRRRVTVHELRNKDWVDLGTGYCSVHSRTTKNGPNESKVIVTSEVAGLIIFETGVTEVDSFVKPQETLILWSKPSTGIEMLFSFQEGEACRTVSTNFSISVVTIGDQ